MGARTRAPRAMCIVVFFLARIAFSSAPFRPPSPLCTIGAGSRRVSDGWKWAKECPQSVEYLAPAFAARITFISGVLSCVFPLFVKVPDRI